MVNMGKFTLFPQLMLQFFFIWYFVCLFLGLCVGGRVGLVIISLDFNKGPNYMFLKCNYLNYCKLHYTLFIFSVNWSLISNRGLV